MPDSRTVIARADRLGAIPAGRVVGAFEPWQRLTCGGLPFSTVSVLFGVPSAGKSTLGLQLTRGIETLYVSTEQHVSAVTEVATRLGVLSPSLWIACETDLREVLRAARDYDGRHRLVVLDSWQCAVWPGVEERRGSRAQMARVLEALIEFAQETRAAVLIVCRARKDGRIAAHQSLIHDVDAVFELSRSRGEFGRKLVTEKIRFGNEGKVRLTMGAQGFTSADACDGDE